MKAHMTTMVKSIEPKLWIFSATLIMVVFTLAGSPTLHAASCDVLDISSYTQNALKMTVLTNGDLAVLDDVDSKIVLLEADGTHIRTFNIGDYVLDPIDITAFPGRIGVLDGTGIPNVRAAYVLLFNTTGSLVMSLSGAGADWEENDDMTPAKEVIGLTQGDYILYIPGPSDIFVIDRFCDGSLIGTGWSLNTGDTIYGYAALHDNEYGRIRQQNSSGIYDVSRAGYFSGDEWGGDALSETGVAGFDGNRLAVLNETQTSLIVFGVPDGYLGRIDGLPTSGLNITNLAGDLNSNYVYVLADSSIIKVTVPESFTAPLSSTLKILNFESGICHLTWSPADNYNLEFDISPYFNPPADIVELADTITEYYYDASAALKGFFRLVKQ